MTTPPFSPNSANSEFYALFFFWNFADGILGLYAGVMIWSNAHIAHT